MLIELHCHSDASGDSLMQPARMIEICRRRGIGRLAVTDHNTLQGALRVKALAPNLVIAGEEIMTTQGELLAYFVKEEIPKGLTPAETIGRLRAQDAVISVAHPFDRLRHGAWTEADLAEVAPLVDAIEVFNARCIFAEDNARALAFARAHGKPGTVGSDAHTYWELGRAALRADGAGDREALLRAFAEGEPLTRLSPLIIHFTSTWAKYWKRLQRRLQPKRG
jgi:predicted metal-dependent phosphoesterase TrpH